MNQTIKKALINIIANDDEIKKLEHALRITKDIRQKEQGKLVKEWFRSGITPSNFIFNTGTLHYFVEINPDAVKGQTVKVKSMELLK